MRDRLIIAVICVVVLLLLVALFGTVRKARAEPFVPTYPMPCRQNPWPLPSSGSACLNASAHSVERYGEEALVKSGLQPGAQYNPRQLGSWYAIDNANWTDLNDSSGTKVTQDYSEQSKVSLTGGGEAPSLRPRYQPANPVSGIGKTSNQRLWSDPLQDPRNGPCSECQTIFELPRGPGALDYVAPDTTDGTVFQGRAFYTPMAGLYDKTFYRKMDTGSGGNSRTWRDGPPGMSSPYDTTPTYPDINLPPLMDARPATRDSSCLSCVGNGCGPCDAMDASRERSRGCSVVGGAGCSGEDQGPTIA